MSQLRKRHLEKLTASAPTTLGTVGLGSKYARLLEIRARNFSDSTKTVAGVDATEKIKITDNHGTVVYLDALDRDYATAEVVLLPSQDDTATGLGVTPVDATGAAATAGAGSPIVMESPVTVVIQNCATATDYFVIDLIVEGDR